MKLSKSFDRTFSDCSILKSRIVVDGLIPIYSLP